MVSALSISVKGTNVRSFDSLVSRIGRLLWPLSRAEHVADMFMTPVRRMTPPMLPERGGPSTRLLVPDSATPLFARIWGNHDAPEPGKGRPVLLVHGWDAHMYEMDRFVEPLLAQGFRVVAFDAPGHGRSFGDKVSLIDFAAAVQAVAKATGPLAGVIGHSLGAAATLLALDHGLQTERVVLVGVAADPAAYLRDCAKAYRLSPEETRDLFAIMDARLPRPISDLSLSALASRQSAPALFLHSTDDRIAPVVEALHTAGLWPKAQVQLHESLGHRRILRAAAVIGQAVDFLARGST